MLTGYRGVIESPNFPGDYPPDQDCTWHINAPIGNKINVTFSHFDLEAAPSYSRDPGCNFDYLEIKDENEEQDAVQTLRGRYCGSERPPRFTSTWSNLYIKFKTDSLLAASGFRLEWVIEGCGGILDKPEGTIQSPNYPHEYPHNVVCEWLIKTDFGQSIHFQMEDVDIEMATSCVFDGINVYDGASVNATQLMSICHSFKGNTTSAATRSNGNNLFVRFFADQSFSGRGFKASYKAVPGREYIYLFI